MLRAGAVMQAVDRILTFADTMLLRLERFAALAGGTLIFAAMIATMVEVVGRRVFNAPIPGFVDLFDVAMTGMTLLGAAYCQRFAGHVRMELLIGKLSGRLKWALELLTTGLALVLIAVVAWASFGQAVKAARIADVSVDILLPLWPSKAMVTVALTLLAARLALNCCGFVRLLVSPTAQPIAIPVSEPLPDDAAVQPAGSL